MAEITIEDMIIEGSITASQALKMGYKWEAIVVGGDAMAIRKVWLKRQENN
jgi:hypothetical protein